MNKFGFYLFVFLFSIQMIINFFQVNYWPFTDYPMFAPPRTIDKVEWFSLNCESKTGEKISIPIRGGAAIMKIYTEAIRKSDFEALKSQMSKDIEEHQVSHCNRFGIKEPRIVLRQLTLTKNKGELIPVSGREIFSFYLKERVR